MAVKEFDLLGGDSTTVREIDIGIPRDMDDLRSGIAAEYKIVSPSSMCLMNVSLPLTLWKTCGILSLKQRLVWHFVLTGFRCWFPR